jgi:hypothetical protein
MPRAVEIHVLSLVKLSMMFCTVPPYPARTVGSPVDHWYLHGLWCSLRDSKFPTCTRCTVFSTGQHFRNFLARTNKFSGSPKRQFETEKLFFHKFNFFRSSEFASFDSETERSQPAIVTFSHDQKLSAALTRSDPSDLILFRQEPRNRGDKNKQETRAERRTS